MLDDVVRTITYITNIEDYCRCVEERYKVLSNLLPTNTLPGVSRLVHPGMVV